MAIFFQFLLGLTALAGGALVFVRGAIRMARGFGWRASTIGLTVLAYGLYAGMLIMTLQASTGAVPDIALGGMIGSVMAAVATLGIAILTRPQGTLKAPNRRDGMLLIAAALAFILLCADGALTRTEGLMLLAALIVYTLYARRTPARRALASALPAEESPEALKKCSMWCATAYALIGPAMMLTGGNLLIDLALRLTQIYALPEAAAGSLVIGISGALPLLIVLLVPRFRLAGDPAAHVHAGMLFLLLGAAGLAAFLTPMPVFERLLAADVWAALGACVLLAAFSWRGRPLTRPQGAALLALYAMYAIYLLQTGA